MMTSSQRNRTSTLSISILIISLLAVSVVLQTDATAEAGPLTINFEIQEESELLQVVGVLAEDSTIKQTFSGQKLAFELFQQSGYFRLNRDTGRITVASLIDRESLCANGIRTCCVASGESDLCVIEFTVQVINIDSKNLLSGTHLVQVVVEILDRNDNPPRFAKPEYHITLAEDAAVGTVENLPSAKDIDSKQFGILRYFMTSCAGETVDETFKLRQQISFDGTNKVTLQLNSGLDREVRSNYTYCIVAVDKGQPSNSGTLTVRVNVEDRNDNSPMWVEGQEFTVSVSESTTPFTKILQLRATDKDSMFGQIRYGIDPRDTDIDNANYFLVNSDSGSIQVQRFLDYETRRRYVIPIVAQDNGQRSATASLTINVLDENDEKPFIQCTPSSQVRIQENKEPRQKLALIMVQDRDSGQNGRFSCDLQDQQGHDADQFVLRRSYALQQKVYYDLYTNRSFDRETKSRYQLFIRCLDEGTPPNVEKQDLTVIIEDVNDHKPYFLRSPYEVEYYEGNMPGESITNIQASDADTGLNGQLEYFLEETARPFLSIHRTSGHLSSVIRFDRESQDLYLFNVTVRDYGTPRLESTVQFKLKILDVNDNSPQFQAQSYEFVVAENATLGTFVGRLNATDADLGVNGTLSFRLKPTYNLQWHLQPFFINSTGHVSLARGLDRETKAQYFLTAEATDHGNPPRSSQVSLIVVVSDVNDSPPKFLQVQRTQINVSCENTAQNYILASTELLAKDDDSDALYNQIRYNISNVYARYGRGEQDRLSHAFKIDSISGQLFVTQVPDEERCLRANYIITIVAYDPTNPAHYARKHVEVHFQPGRRSLSPNNAQGARRLGEAGGNSATGSGRAKNTHNNEGQVDDLGRDENNSSSLRHNNLIVIISLVCASIIILLILGGTLCVLRRRGINFHFYKGSVDRSQRTLNMDSPSMCPLPRKLIHTLDGKIDMSQPMETEDLLSVNVLKSRASVDNIHATENSNKDYEKMKWTTYQREKMRQTSLHSNELHNGYSQMTMDRLQYHNTADKHNAYQSLGTLPYSKEIAHSAAVESGGGETEAEYYIACQSDKGHPLPKDSLQNDMADVVALGPNCNTTLLKKNSSQNSQKCGTNSPRAINNTKRIVVKDNTPASQTLKSSYFTISFV